MARNPPQTSRRQASPRSAAKASAAHVQLGQLVKSIPRADKAAEQRRTMLRTGQALRRIRTERLGITQAEAAKLAGLKQPDIAMIERANMARGAGIERVGRIVDAYNAALAAQDQTLSLSILIKLTKNGRVIEQDVLAGEP